MGGGVGGGEGTPGSGALFLLHFCLDAHRDSLVLSFLYVLAQTMGTYLDSYFAGQAQLEQ